MNPGAILVVNVEKKLGKLNGLKPGERVIFKEILFNTPEIGNMLRVELEDGREFSVYEKYFCELSLLREKKIISIIGKI